MSPLNSNHVVDINKTGAPLKRIGRAGESATPVDIFQAACICGWTGPRRTNAWEAENDARNHEQRPEEGQ